MLKTFTTFGCRAMSTVGRFRPVVIAGPSGSGKSTLYKKLMDEFKDCFAFSVSHTTRNPRPGEERGKDYHYVTRDEMQEAITNNAFLEHAQFSGNMYGTSKKSVEDVISTGRICILDIEMQGVKSVKKTDLNARFIFIKPPEPSLEVLESRLRKRETETEESLQKRLETAKQELLYANENGAYDHVIINDDLDVAYQKLKGILIKDITAIQDSKFKKF